ncbi:acyl-CoA dehydrogenase family protein [Archangium sp.]|uniref:acyl-CoA dehydrogenase family protein n=1 Tax=Archangium sp. TaxID=1872627 RepID=UPI002EDB583D
MDFSWKQEEEELYQRALAFAGKQPASSRPEQPFPLERWRSWGEFGFLGLSIPEAYGGMGLGALMTARLAEAFGRGCEDTGLVFSAMAHLLACVMPIVEHGSEAQKQRLLPKLASGEMIGANAITEADSGSDVYALKSRAVRDGDFYVLNGVKSYVTNAPVADLFLVYAQTNPSDGYLGLSAFLVEKGTPGVTVGQPFDTLGLKTSPIASVYFDDCRVPLSARLGVEGQGAPIFNGSMQWERSCLFAAYVGLSERLLERSVQFARQRRQFNKPIGKNQAVSHRVADMKLRLESARLLVYRACWRLERGEDASVEIALAKLAASEGAVQSGLDAIQIHGGMGIIQETGIEAALRDSIPSTLFSGTSEMQRELIARKLGL